jgi:hypothetical protein
VLLLLLLLWRPLLVLACPPWAKCSSVQACCPAWRPGGGCGPAGCSRTDVRDVLLARLQLLLLLLPGRRGDSEAAPGEAAHRLLPGLSGACSCCCYDCVHPRLLLQGLVQWVLQGELAVPPPAASCCCCCCCCCCCFRVLHCCEC